MASGAAVTSATTDPAPSGTPSNDGGGTSRRDRRHERHRHGVWWTLGIIVVVGLAYALVLRALYHVPGSAMEEGFVLVFPDRLLHGDLPNRDFLNLYGPGSIWVLALIYQLFGVTVFVERTVGLLQLIGTTVAICLLVRWWGRSVVLTAGLLSVAFGVPAVGLTAIPWAGGVAFAGFGLLALQQARRRAADDPGAAGRRAGGGWALAAGVLFGAALLYRLDLVVAIVLGAAVLVWGAGRRVEGRVAWGGGVRLG